MDKSKSIVESKKAKFGGIGIAAILGMVAQGVVSGEIGAIVIGVITITEILAWAYQDKGK